MGNVEEGIWQIDLSLYSASGVEWKIVDSTTGLEFGSGYPWPIAVPSEGYLKEDGTPVSLSGTLDGDYRLTFNERSMKYRFERRSQTDLEWINLVSNQNEWSRTADPMFMTGDYSWQVDVESTPGEFLEFVLVADGKLESQWGSPDSEHREGTWSAASQKLGAPFKTTIAQSGMNRIVFNEKTGEVSCRPLEPAEIPPRPTPPPPEPMGELNHPPVSTTPTDLTPSLDSREAE
jgi:hypothetical protein